MPAPGLNPYVQQSQQGAGRTPYGMGGGYGGYGASRYRPNLSGAVTGPSGSGGTGGGQLDTMRNQQAEGQEKQAQEAGALANEDNANANAGAAQRNAQRSAYMASDPDHANAVADSVTAGKLGTDPSASPADIAAAANGPTRFGADGMPTGAGTAPTPAGGGLDGTPPAPAAPGQAQPNSSDVTTAAAAVQAAKDGALNNIMKNAYSGGMKPQPGASPFLNKPPGQPAQAMPPTPAAGASATAAPAAAAPPPGQAATTSTNAPANGAPAPANGAPVLPAKSVATPKVVAPVKPAKAATVGTTMKGGAKPPTPPTKKKK